MLYQDTGKVDPLVRKPVFLLAVVIVVMLALALLDLTGTILGELLRPAIGEPAESGWFGRLSIGFVVGFALAINVFAISFLPLRWQVALVWLELLALFLFFFYSFGLDFNFIRSKLWFMISQGVVTTLYISGISLFFATILALIGAIAKLSSNGFAYAIASFYTSFFRGLPLLMQVYLIYLGLPQVGYVIGAVPAGVLALSLCYGAYMTEIFRAGIQSIPKGQWEASRALGLRFGRTMRSVILPQSLPLIIPPTGNQFIAMLKDSTLVSVIGVQELMFLAKRLGAKDFKHMEMLITAAVIYWVLSIALELIQSRIERHYKTVSH